MNPGGVLHDLVGFIGFLVAIGVIGYACITFIRDCSKNGW